MAPLYFKIEIVDAQIVYDRGQHLCLCARGVNIPGAQEYPCRNCRGIDEHEHRIGFRQG